MRLDKISRILCIEIQFLRILIIIVALLFILISSDVLGRSADEYVDSTNSDSPDITTFPDGTLLKGSTPEIYIVEDGKRRWITSLIIFESMGLRFDLIKIVSDEELKLVLRGPDITAFPEDVNAVSDRELSSIYSRCYFRGNYYQLISQEMNWHDAKTYAESIGGHLVTISDEDENRFVADLAKSRGWSEAVWIGLTDENNERIFTWITGEPLSYTNWFIGEPDDVEDQDYGTIGAGGPYQWDDLWGNSLRRFVVEFEADGAVSDEDPTKLDTQFITLGSNSPNFIYDGIPFEIHDVLLQVDHGISNKDKATLNLSGHSAKAIHVLLHSGYSDNVPDNVLVGNINIYYNNSTMKSFELISGINIAEWAYDREELQQCLQHTKIKPAYSFLTKLDSSTQYYGHYFYIEIDLNPPEDLNYLELILNPNAYQNQISYCSPSDWYAIVLRAITLETCEEIEDTNSESLNGNADSGQVPPVANLKPLYRYYSSIKNDHYYTTDPNEILDSYYLVGITGYVATEPMSGTTGLYRYYSSSQTDHFYTTNPSNEILDGYVSEGITGYIAVEPMSGTTELLHYYSSSATDHFYTINLFLPGELLDVYDFVGVTGYIWLHDELPSFTIPKVSADVEALSIRPGETRDVTFTVTNEGADSDVESYLSVSVSPGLHIKEYKCSSDEMRFKHSQVGSKIWTSDNSQMNSEHELLDAYKAYASGESNTITVTIEPTGDEAAEGGQQWIKYRAAFDTIGEGNDYVRDPTSGPVDQQGWPVYEIPVTVTSDEIVKIVPEFTYLAGRNARGEEAPWRHSMTLYPPEGPALYSLPTPIITADVYYKHNIPIGSTSKSKRSRATLKVWQEDYENEGFSASEENTLGCRLREKGYCYECFGGCRSNSNGLHLQINLPEDAPKGWYDAKIDLYYTTTGLDGWMLGDSVSIDKAFKIIDGGEIPGINHPPKLSNLMVSPEELWSESLSDLTYSVDYEDEDGDEPTEIWVNLGEESRWDTAFDMVCVKIYSIDETYKARYEATVTPNQYEDIILLGPNSFYTYCSDGVDVAQSDIVSKPFMRLGSSSPDITVSINAVPQSGEPGSEVAFYINVKNTGDQTFEVVRLDLFLPRSMKYLSDDREGSPQGVSVYWPDLGKLIPGESTIVRTKIIIDGDAYGEAEVKAFAAGSFSQADDCYVESSFELNYIYVGFNEIEFHGECLDHYIVDARNIWTIKMDEKIEGPSPRSDVIQVHADDTPSGFCDNRIEVGDQVHVFGRYSYKDSILSINEKSEYYIKLLKECDIQSCQEGSGIIDGPISDGTKFSLIYTNCDCINGKCKCVDESKEIPARKVLDGIPSLSQGFFKGWCAWASAQMVLEYYGYYTTAEEIGIITYRIAGDEWEGESSGLKYTQYPAYEQAIGEFSQGTLELEWHYFSKESPNDEALRVIIDAIENDWPVLIFASLDWTGLNVLDNPDIGHASVLVGYSLKDNEGIIVPPPSIKFHDPATCLASGGIGWGTYWINYNDILKRTIRDEEELKLAVVKVQTIAPTSSLPLADTTINNANIFKPFRRWCNSDIGDHFYTTHPTGEIASDCGYVYEGIAGYIATEQINGTTALHRWYNGDIGDHFYTINPTGEPKPNSGYVYEGITGYIWLGPFNSFSPA